MKLEIIRQGVPPASIYVKPVYRPDDQEERPVTLILPGGPGGNHHMYESYHALLPVSDLVFHDPRGCGSSEAVIESCTMDNYIDDVETLRQKLHLHQVVILGKSYGSMCALGYALRYPTAVSKLILAAGAPSFHFLKLAQAHLLKEGTPQQIEIGKKLWEGGFTSREELLKFFELTNPLYSIKARKHPELFDLNKKSTLMAYDVLNLGFKNKFWSFDYVDRLHEIKVPTLILAGKHDWINDVSLAELMHSKIKNSQLHVFENASHAMEIDVTVEYFQRIADFITAP